MKQASAGRGLALIVEHGEKMALGLVTAGVAVGFLLFASGDVGSQSYAGPRRAASSGAAAVTEEATDVLALLTPKPLSYFAPLYERDPFSMVEVTVPTVPAGGETPTEPPPPRKEGELRITGISTGATPYATVVGTVKEVEVVTVGNTFEVNVAGARKAYKVVAIDSTGVEIEDLDTGARRKLLLNRQEVNPDEILERTSSGGGGVAPAPSGE